MTVGDDAVDPGEVGLEDLGMTALPGVVLTAVELDVLGVAHLRSLQDPADGPMEAPPAVAPQATVLSAMVPPVAVGGARADDARTAEVRSGEAAAREQARLSLRSRGLLDAAGELVVDGILGETVCLMLDIRLAVERFLVLDRVVGAGEDEDAETRDTRVLHVMDIGACVEDITQDGLHQLTLLPEVGSCADLVADFLVPTDAAPATGQVRPGELDTEQLTKTNESNLDLPNA